jgi:hypothetical protein
MTMSWLEEEILDEHCPLKVPLHFDGSVLGDLISCEELYAVPRWYLPGL